VLVLVMMVMIFLLGFFYFIAKLSRWGCRWQQQQLQKKLTLTDQEKTSFVNVLTLYPSMPITTLGMVVLGPPVKCQAW
jgi:hypothetical protein